MKAYKWSLRKGGKKMRCPRCGQMRFVPFVLSADGKTMAGPEFGRCDREQSCGYFRYPDKEAKSTVEVEPRPELPPALFTFLPNNTLNYEGNSLFDAFADLVGRNRMIEAFRRYYIGTGIHGACVFPQFDGVFLRTAKAIHYGKDGHRLKDMQGDSLPVSWYHKNRDAADYMKSHRLKQCFFGQHLLEQHPRRDVWIVEAEKTAVLMAATDERTDRIWLACGGSQMLKGAIDLECLRHRKVVLVPDDGQFWNWMRVADMHGWGWVDISFMKDYFDCKEGCDIWDIRECKLKKSKKTKNQ